MNFHEVRLPARLAFGSTGGVERRTEIATLGSGFERRSSPWLRGRRRYLIGAGLRSLEDMAALTEFFEARRGRLFGFRFRDFADFRSCGPGGQVSPLDQAIGTGTGSATGFQLVKRYGDEAGGWMSRVVAKPVVGSVRVAVEGAEVGPGLVSVDATTGEVVFETPPEAGAAITAGFLFDTPVRFDSDRIEVTLETFGAGRMAAMPLIEVRV